MSLWICKPDFLEPKRSEQLARSTTRGSPSPTSHFGTSPTDRQQPIATALSPATVRAPELGIAELSESEANSTELR